MYISDLTPRGHLHDPGVCDLCLTPTRHTRSFQSPPVPLEIPRQLDRVETCADLAAGFPLCLVLAFHIDVRESPSHAVRFPRYLGLGVRHRVRRGVKEMRCSDSG